MNTHELLLARQPILDARLSIVGYELLCRPVPEDTQEWQLSHGDRATSEVLISAFNDLGIEDVTEGKPAFINFTTHWLHQPPIIPSLNMVAELLEHIEITPENLQALEELRTHGYQVALDDYTGNPQQEALFPLVDIIKVDIRQLPTLDLLDTMIRQYEKYGLTWLAEKVETREEYERCKAAGCTLFQGYFFSRPANVYGRRLPDNAVAVLNLMQTLNKPDADISDIAEVIQSDPQLSYKLLKIINSAAIGYAREVTSIAQGIMIAGLNRLKAWANLIALGRLQNKPVALREQAVVRAHLAKSLALQMPELDADTAFTLGLFSLLDAFLDQPMETICDKLHLPETLRRALLERYGDYGFILNTTISMEQADWDSIDWEVLKGISLVPADVEMQYLQALQTSRQILATTAA
mgnify:CR=1 FL=1|tara:strand:- start:18789 stop:20018 length:1230 start_codon:yes stop_codon:yes gene_type:complete